MKARLNRGAVKTAPKLHRVHYAGLERRRDEILSDMGMDHDTRILWTLRDKLGWGRRNLLRFYAAMLSTHSELHKNWKDSKFDAMRYELAAVGVDCDAMISAAKRRALVLKANMPEYMRTPKAMDTESRLINGCQDSVRERAVDFEAHTIYMLHYDFGVSRPKIQQVINDIIMHYEVYDYIRDADELARLREELMKIGVNVAALQRDAEACIAAELAAEMEEQNAGDQKDEAQRIQA